AGIRMLVPVFRAGFRPAARVRRRPPPRPLVPAAAGRPRPPAPPPSPPRGGWTPTLPDAPAPVPRPRPPRRPDAADRVQPPRTAGVRPCPFLLRSTPSSVSRTPPSTP